MRALKVAVGLAVMAGGLESGALVAPLFAQEAALSAPAAIDPRAATALDEVIARYRKARSFSLVATTETRGGAATSYSRSETTVQFPLRARLKVNRIDRKGSVATPLTRRLIGAKNYQVWDLVSSDYKPNASQFRMLDSDRDRAAAWSDISQANPELGYSVFALVAGTNPAKSNSVTKTSMYVEKHGSQEFERIFVQRRHPGAASPVLLEFLIASATKDLREFVLRQHIGNSDFVTVSRFGPPVPAWKASQEALDAAVYNWKTIAIAGVDEPAPRPPVIVNIDAKARGLFARTAKLYGGLPALQLAWREEIADPKIPGGQQTAVVSIFYERRGRLRLEDSLGMDQVVVIGATTKSRLDSSGLSYGEKAKYKVEPFAAGQEELRTAEALEWGGGHVVTLSKWLERTNVLEAAEVQTAVDADELSGLRAVALPEQSLNGLACDLVQVTRRFDNKFTLAKGETTETVTYWLAHDDGRLVRVQTNSVEGQEKPYVADLKVTGQDLKPVFAEGTFVFTPPKGAVLDKE